MSLIRQVFLSFFNVNTHLEVVDKKGPNVPGVGWKGNVSWCCRHRDHRCGGSGDGDGGGASHVQKPEQCVCLFAINSLFYNLSSIPNPNPTLIKQRSGDLAGGTKSTTAAGAHVRSSVYTTATAHIWISSS